jgi:ABC-2 type transport system ATP-binding protein
MSDTPPILLQGIGVQYDLRLNKKRSLRGTLLGAYRRDNTSKFWALKEIDLRVDHGESVAVLGKNGAGKSTLLQVLAGIIEPSEGRIAVRGSIATLLQLGAGFDDQLDAIENVHLVGAFLGFSRAAMEKKLPEILEFADLGQFIDSPVRTYSSGMRARLGFSVATAVDPDVLLLDEVLSTGDAGFREKSRARVVELMGKARAIVYVTHDLDSAAQFCPRAITLERGKIVDRGPTSEVVERYKQRTAVQGL